MITSSIHHVKEIKIHKPYKLRGGSDFVQKITVTCSNGYPGKEEHDLELNLFSSEKGNLEFIEETSK